METKNIRINWSRDYMGSIEDAAGNLHFWHAAWQDSFNKRLLFCTVEHCGDYAHRKTTFCITRCKSAEPVITSLGPLYDMPESVMQLVAADVLKAILNI
jgi:hypothetical protein